MTHEIRYWDLAGPLALAWFSFEDVDFVRYPGRLHAGMIIAKSPRRKLRPRISGSRAASSSQRIGTFKAESVRATRWGSSGRGPTRWCSRGVGLQGGGALYL